MTDNVSAGDNGKASSHIFWASYFGWLLDGYDTTIYAFVLVGALTALGISGITNISHFGLMFFAIFLTGWGTSFIFGPLADKIGRMNMLGLSILLYAIGTFFSGLSFNLVEFAIARFIAGLGLGGEWFLGGTSVSETFPEGKRQIMAGRFHSGWYLGFIVAAVTTPILLLFTNFRVIFMIGIIPAALLGYIRIKTKEPEVWKMKKDKHPDKMNMMLSLKTIFSKQYRRTTIILVLVMIPVVTGLYGGTLFAPTAIINMSHNFKGGLAFPWNVVLGGTIISFTTLVFCILMPYMVRSIGRKATLTFFMIFMILGLVIDYGFIYSTNNLSLFLPLLALLGIGGADFSVFSLWVPEIYPTEARAGGFGIITTVARYVGAGLVFLIAYLAAVLNNLGYALAFASIAFVIGIIVLQFVHEDRNKELDRSVDLAPTSE
ncbi:MAG: MFS transporter [Candidatus Thermoplasmatota archaeon]|nr:MFS transporter [Candidatus Thermoplasmatota archaeon]MDA8143387.1 MFS transporter [Thermoplasmatales archaeon]